jgi:hypothetical protein
MFIDKENCTGFICSVGKVLSLGNVLIERWLYSTADVCSTGRMFLQVDKAHAVEIEILLDGCLCVGRMICRYKVSYIHIHCN